MLTNARGGRAIRRPRFVPPVAPPPDLPGLLDRPTVTPADFFYLGGWRMYEGTLGGDGIGFIRPGTIHVEHGVGNERIITIVSELGGRQGYVLSVNLDDMGLDPGKVGEWPRSTPVRMLSDIAHPDVYANFGVLGSNNMHVTGISRPNGGMYLSTGQVNYAASTASQRPPWFSWVDPVTGVTTSSMTVPASVANRPAYGGGTLDIPQWFADQYLQGRNFGVGYGGYHSGQGSSPGPTLFACDRPADGAAILTNVIPIMRYPWEQGWNISTNWPYMRANRPQRPGDITGHIFGPPSQGGITWIQADHVAGGVFWIDTPTKQGFCCIMAQGVGFPDYDLQAAAVFSFCTQGAYRLYVYHPQEFIDVIQGVKTVSKPVPQYYEWPHHPWFGDPTTVDNRDIMGTYFDKVDKYLYIMYKAISGGRPVVAVYSLEPPSGTILDSEDGTGVVLVGEWNASTSTKGYWGDDYRITANQSVAGQSVTYSPALPQHGSYQVYMRWAAASNRAGAIPVDIYHTGGTSTVVINQKTGGFVWNLLGTFTFTADGSPKLKIRTDGTTGYTVADAVRFVKV